MDDLRERLRTALAGSHEIERELGGGGMSRTYVARERAFDRRVVIKVLAPELLAGLSVERFRREVLLAAQLQHPHVVPVLTAGDVDGLPWFTMPYVDGDSLRHRLAQGPVGLTETVGILRDVARALAYAHNHGVVHRDIKPDNVLLSAGSATVTDFGIAKAINAARTDSGEQSPALTMTGMSIGTPTYMSPEQAAGDPNTDARSDLYSFGAMAYELLAGRPPFHGLPPAKLLAAHLGERPRHVREHRPDCPEALAELVMQCLEKEPEARPAAATDLVRVLDTITSSGAAAAAPAILSGGRIRLGKALALWGAAAAVVIVTTWAAREVIGLPDWTLAGAIGVMIAGLPMILATWYAQRAAHRAYTATPHQTPGGTAALAPQGTMATLALKASPMLSWRRTWLGGAIAVGGFAAAIIGFMVMRAAGIGPFGSLQGKGAFGARETVVVADFRSPADDPTLGATVAEAIRTDLAQSSALDILSRAQLREAMMRMRRDADDPIPFDVARELATREGAKAILDGAIVQLGRSYVITARLVSALDGEELLPFRETAATEDDLLPALGRLTRVVRERSGESIKSIRKSDELSRVTTASLPALRKYVEGLRQSDEIGDLDRGLELLQEAVELDTAFAMAWRKMSAILNNEGREPARAMRALETAYRHRDRLTELERHFTEGYYFTRGPRVDWRRAVQAYEAAARVPGAGSGGLNNAAVVYGYLRESERAEQLYRQVVASDSRFATAWTNLMTEQLKLGMTAALDSSRAGFRAAFPQHEQQWFADWIVAVGNERWVEADSISRAILGSSASVNRTLRTAMTGARIAQLRGRPQESLAFAAQGRQAVRGTTPPALFRLTNALDSATIAVLVQQDPVRGRAMLERAVRANPLEALDRAEQPWERIIFLAAATEHVTLAHRARDGALAKVGQIGPDSVGVAAYLDAMVAIASREWTTAATRLQEADRRLMVLPEEAHFWKAYIHDQVGNLDSARVEYERFTRTRELPLLLYGPAGAQAHRRLGELHEANGDRAAAIREYETFVDRWRDAEPELQPQVREVRARLDRLRPPG